MKTDPTALIAQALSQAGLVELYKLYFAFTKNGLKDASAFMDFFHNNICKATYDLCFASALQRLSKLPLAEIPPLLWFLDSPSAPGFPQQALGLQLLLGEVPRRIVSGLNKRWAFGVFLDLAIRTAKELALLKDEYRIDNVERWQALGYSFEDAWLRFFMATTAYTRSENLDAHMHGQNLVEQKGRQIAENHNDIVDPTREFDDEDISDIGLFPRMMKDPAEGLAGKATVEAIWRVCRLVRAHGPILVFYGRFPYRNRFVGRADAGKEAAFFVLTDSWGVGDEETGKVLNSEEGFQSWPIQTLDSEFAMRGRDIFWSLRCVLPYKVGSNCRSVLGDNEHILHQKKPSQLQ